MFKISGAIRTTSTPDGAVLLDIRQGRILSLNTTGSRVLELLEGGFDQDEIACEISKECGVDAHQVRADVRDFIRALQEHNVLEAA